MKKAFSTAIVAFLVLWIFSSAIAIQPSKGAPSETSFSDHFDGSNVDTNKWLVQENTQMSGLPAFGGSVKIANSQICLASTDHGTSFPCVTSAFNPFPSSGDFVVEFDVTYTCISDWGSGMWISNGPFIVDGVNYFANILQIWADGGYTQTSIRAWLLGKQIYQDTYGWEENSNTRVFRLEYIEGVYTVFVDSVEVAKESSHLRPDTIGFGHPPAYYVPFTHEHAIGNAGRWSSFKIGFIRIRELRPAVISLSTSTLMTSLGFEVDIDGALCNSEGAPLVGETVVMSYLIQGVGEWNPFASTTTALDGSYSVAWLPTATGNFAVKAEWSGDEVFAGTYAVKNISVIRGNGANFFFAESNSTLSTLTFDSTSPEVSFTVSGPSGTTGYVKFLISKSLLSNVMDLKVYIDGQQVEYAASSVGDLLSLYVGYTHSSHEVLIKLPLSTVAETSTPLSSQQSSSSSEPQLLEPVIISWSMLATVFAVVSMGLVVHLRKRK